MTEQEWRKYYHSIDWVKKARNDMAKLYRNLRRDRPDMARLLFAREREAAARLSGHILKKAQSK